MLASLRIGVGGMGFFAPGLFARVWLGPSESDRSSNPAVRGLAARDAALGLGLLFALRRGSPVRGWLEAGALADMADATGSLLAPGAVSRTRRLFFTASGSAAAAAGIGLARKLGED